MSPTIVMAATELTEPVAGGGRLVLSALVGIALIVALITFLKVHPFLALIVGGLAVGIVAGVDVADVVTSFTTGFGTTAAGVGILIALGAMFAKLLADSGGADEIVDAIVGRASTRSLPWAMAAVGALIGLPMFFEIGLVLLMPVIYLVARRAQLSLVTVGIPALAGLSAMHGLVPPHPGPLVAIDALVVDDDVGERLAHHEHHRQQDGEERDGERRPADGLLGLAGVEAVAGSPSRPPTASTPASPRRPSVGRRSPSRSSPSCCR
jgi:GntP family gluconate:H+ symporter